MRYFKLNILGNNKDKSLALITKSVVDIGLYSYCMAEGKRVGAKYPKNAQVYLQPEKPGETLSSFIGNTKSYLIVNSELKEVIMKTGKDSDKPIEALPFTLYDHNKRVLSKDYWIINPIGTFDCVDRKASEITYMDGNAKGEIVSVKKFVFNRKKLKNAPDLFRVPEDPTEYFLNEQLVKKFQEKKFINIFLTEVEQN